MTKIKHYWIGMLGILLLACQAPAIAASNNNEIRIGLRAIQGNKIALQRWQPTANYLARKIPGYRFSIRPYDNLAQMMKAAGDKQFDFVFTNPSSYVEMKLRYNAKSFATLINRRHNSAQTKFGSVIFTHVENTDILNLKNLEGKSFMAVSEPAFGGWQVAWLELLQNNIDPYADFSQLSWGKGNQHNVVYAVRDKTVNAGVVRTDMLERMAAMKLIDLRTFRILNPHETEGFPFFHSTPLYPEWPFATLPHVAPELQAKVKSALLSMPKTDKAAQAGQYVGWIDSLDYEPVRQLMQKLAVGPYKNTASANMIMGKWLLLILFAFLVFYLLRKSYQAG